MSGRLLVRTERYWWKQMRDKEKIIINDYIQGDPLSEENLDKTLNFLHEFRLSCPNKSIWLYSGFTWNQIMNPVVTDNLNPSRDELIRKRQDIVKQCTVLVDGRYIDSQRNPSKKWAGSDNQKVVNIRQSLQQNKIILWCN